MTSSSPAHHKPHPLLFSHSSGAISAPPPTPSSQQPNLLCSSASEPAADALSRLLHRQLAPTLSLPSRFRRAAAAPDASPPTVSLSQSNSSQLLTAASEHGFFLLTDHRVSPRLAESSESDSASLFSLPRERKRELFPMNWPVGFIDDDDEEEEDEEEDDKSQRNASFCFDLDSMSDSTDRLSQLPSLSEMTRELETVAMEVVEMLFSALGFENPFIQRTGEGKPTGKWCSLMWVSESESGGSLDGKTGQEGRYYPYVVGLQYQVRSQRYCLETDTDTRSVTVSPPVGSVLALLGDISQVWSNGKTKKVRGKPIPINDDDAKNMSTFITMTLLVTLPLESNVSPLLPAPVLGVDEGINEDNAEAKAAAAEDASISSAYKSKDVEELDQKRLFCSFSFKDYAWRVYHERLFLKDPLDRYRIRSSSDD